jgi:serine protease Do
MKRLRPVLSYCIALVSLGRQLHCRPVSAGAAVQLPHQHRTLAVQGSIIKCIAFVLLLGAPALAALAGAPPDLPALCNRVKPAFVFISGGSGVVVSPEGWMLTNSHVIGNGKQFDVRTGDGRHYRAKLLGRDVTGDLAALQLELKPKETVPHLAIGDPDTLHIGDHALAVGNPFAEGLVDQNPTFTLGVISALNQTTGSYADAVATDAAVNPGNSGGPLINMAGEVAGINGQIATRWGLRSSTGLGYAIGARQIRLWLPRLVKAGGGDVPHGRLLGLEFDTEEEALWKAPTVKEVFPGSPADKYGFKAGDQVTKFDGKPILNIIQLAQALRIYPQDYEAPVTVQREGKDVELRAKLVALKHGALGVKFARPGPSDEFVRVAEVAKDSPADKAGLKQGDEILAIDHSELKMPAQEQFQLLAIWLDKGVFAGEPVRMKVRRKEADGKTANHDIRVMAK